jgi:hypothetical protein
MWLISREGEAAKAVELVTAFSNSIFVSAVIIIILSK